MTKLAMKKAQFVNQEDVHIASQIDNVVKITKDTIWHHLEPSRLKVLSKLQVY